MGNVKIRYYVVKERHGKRLAYWQPSAEMRRQGFQALTLGQDGPEAWKRAEAANAAWEAHRRGREAPRRPTWPTGSLGAAFDAYRHTDTWARKAPRTREDWDRGWRYISPDFGDVRPASATLDVVDLWYTDVLERAGVREAHRAMKIWRALWNVAAAMGYCARGGDPSLGIRRHTPPRRRASWQAREVEDQIGRAWRAGYHGLALALSIAWDTALSPVDVRTIRAGEVDRTIGRFGAVIRERTKTGQASIGLLSRRSRWMLDRALAHAAHHPDAPIIRTRRGRPYTKNDLAKDFRATRGAGETRKIADIRRSVAIEARAGGATREQVASLLANRIDDNADLERTYLPVDPSTVSAAGAARIAARKRSNRERKLDGVRNEAGTPTLTVVKK